MRREGTRVIIKRDHHRSGSRKCLPEHHVARRSEFFGKTGAGSERKRDKEKGEGHAGGVRNESGRTNIDGSKWNARYADRTCCAAESLSF